jgi:hypothetical protein
MIRPLPYATTLPVNAGRCTDGQMNGSPNDCGNPSTYSYALHRGLIFNNLASYVAIVRLLQ